MAFNFFNFMVMFAVLGGAYLIYNYFFMNKKGEKISVDYSENIGDKLIDHGIIYDGYIDEKKDVLIIPKLNLKRPVPPSNCFSPTTTGKKKIYLVKFDIDRFGYRIPNVHNKIYIKEKLPNGKFVMKKYLWKLCDDVVEQDTKHWEEHTLEQIKIQHRKRDDALTKWIGPISMAMIFLLAVIMNTQTVKTTQETLDKVILEKQQIMDDAKKTTDNMNNLIEKITGTKVLGPSEEEKRQDLIENTPP